MTQQVDSLKKELMHQEFFHEEYKKEAALQKKKAERLAVQLETERDKNVQVIEDPVSAANPDSLDHKIAAFTAGDPEWDLHFHRAFKYLGVPDKEPTFIILKHNQKTGKFDITCEQIRADLPILADIPHRYGSGRYRLMLRYWDPEKRVKGNKVKGAYTLTYRDRTLSNPYESAMSDADMLQRVAGHYREVFSMMDLVIEKYQSLSELYTSVHKLLKELGGRDET